MKKGFTLVELLAVIGLLGIIITLTTISVVKLRKQSLHRLCEEKVTLIETAAKDWGKENLNELPSNSTCKIMYVYELISAGKLAPEDDSADYGERIPVPGKDNTYFDGMTVCIKYEDVYSGKTLPSDYTGMTKYEVTASLTDSSVCDIE